VETCAILFKNYNAIPLLQALNLNHGQNCFALLRKESHTIEYYFQSFLRREEEGFTYFFNLYYETLAYFAFSIVKQKETAEDLTEEAFVKLLECRENFEAPENLKRYLFIVLRNACINWLRKQKHVRQYQQSTDLASTVETPTIIQSIIAAETLFAVYQALENLPPKCARIFRMFYLEQKSLQEIADELNLSVSTVKNQKGRAVQLLRKGFTYFPILFIWHFFLCR
jgi:RNA polymerase sigma-70 factor (ECF subfamily)